jgi:hypothetical protein
MMFRLMLSSFIFAGTLALGGWASAQGTSVSTPAPFVDRAMEKERIEQRKLGMKWAACKKQAKFEKIKLRERKKFMDDCMAK